MLRAALNNVLIVLLKWERPAARPSFHPGELISLISVSKGLEIFATPDSCITTAFSVLAKHGNAKRSLTNNAQFRQAGVVLECQSVSMSLRSCGWHRKKRKRSRPSAANSTLPMPRRLFKCS